MVDRRPVEFKRIPSDPSVNTVLSRFAIQKEHELRKGGVRSDAEHTNDMNNLMQEYIKKSDSSDYRQREEAKVLYSRILEKYKRLAESDNKEAYIRYMSSVANRSPITIEDVIAKRRDSLFEIFNKNKANPKISNIFNNYRRILDHKYYEYDKNNPQNNVRIAQDYLVDLNKISDLVQIQLKPLENRTDSDTSLVTKISKTLGNRLKELNALDLEVKQKQEKRQGLISKLYGAIFGR